jgi:hypothetical protein
VRLDDRLRAADARLVPTLAVRLRTLVDDAAVRRARGREALRRAGARVTDPSTVAPLRRLDDRLATRGPLALLRDVPQLGLLLIAAVFLAGSGVALERSGSDRRAADARERLQASIPTTLGPAPGTSVAVYLAATRKRAVMLSAQSPDGLYTALVSFNRYLTPAQAVKVLGDLEIHKVIAHAHITGAEVVPIPVTTNLVQDVSAMFTAIAKRKLRDRKEFLNLGSSISGTSKEDLQFKAFYADAARTAALEAAAYEKNCACIVGALVRGKARDLAALPALSGVRAVDIGGGDDDTLQLQPLLPEQTKTVTRPVTGVQGNGA